MLVVCMSPCAYRSTLHYFVWLPNHKHLLELRVWSHRDYLHLCCIVSGAHTEVVGHVMSDLCSRAKQAFETYLTEQWMP